jgi:recombinational DNA repair protein (RecF pathway)
MMMAFVVLLSSTGFGLVEHSCMMSGKSVELAALKKESAGCSSCVKKIAARADKSSHPVFKKKACCEENHTFQKLDVVTSTSQAAKILKSSPQAAAISKEALRSLSSFLPFLLPPSSTSSFPPFFPKFYGRTMLSFVQSFLI